MRPPRWLKTALRVAFLVFVVVAVVLAVRGDWDKLRDALARTGFAATGGSLVAVLAGLFASAMVWRALLTDLGAPLRLRTALHVFFLGQLGKYLPGSVWPVVAQMELGKAHGLSRRPVGTVALLVMVLNVATGLLVAVVLLPFTSPHALSHYGWAIAFLPVGLALLHPRILNPVVNKAFSLAHREPLEQPLTLRGIAIATGWTMLMWASYGVQIWALADGLHATGAKSLLALSTGAFALAWTAGFLFIVSPAGAGVREAILILALNAVLHRPELVALAAVSRLLMTAGDLVWGAVGGLTGRARNGGTPARDVTPATLLPD
jgi:hypothetical protein